MWSTAILLRLVLGLQAATEPPAELEVEGDLATPVTHRFVAREDGLYTIDARSLDADVTLAVTTPEGVEVRDDDSGLCTNARVVLQTSRGDAYAVLVGASGDAFGRYSLRVAAGRPEAVEPDELSRRSIEFRRLSAERAAASGRVDIEIEHRIRQAELLILANDATAAAAALHPVSTAEETDLGVRVAATLARAELRTGEPDALARLAAAADRLAERGLHRAEILARWDVANRLYQQMNRDDTYAELERVAQLARILGDRLVEAQTLHRRGQHAAMHGDPEVAIECWRAASALFEDLGKRGDAHDMVINLAATQMLVDDWDGAEASIARARRLIDETGDAARETYALIMLAAVHRHRWDLTRTREVLEAALAAARSGGDATTQHLQQALIELGELLMVLGDADVATGFAEEAVRVAVARGSARDEANALTLVGRIQQQQHRYDEAEVSYLRAHSLAERSHSIFTEIHAETLIAGLCVDQGRCEEGLERADRVIARLGGHHSQNFAIASHMTAGDALQRLGRYRRAERRYRSGLEIARLQGDGPHQADLLARLGGLQLALGDTDVALATMREARDFAASRGDPEAEAHAVLGIVEALVELGRLQEAMETLGQRGDWPGLPRENVRAMVLESRAAAAVGDTDHAISIARDARGRCDADPRLFRGERRQALIAEAAAHLAAGSTALAGDLSQQARIEAIEAGTLEDELDATAILVSAALEQRDQVTARKGLERADRLLRVLTSVELDVDQAAIYRARRSSFASLRQDLGELEASAAASPIERRAAVERAFLAEGHWKARALLARRDAAGVDPESAERRRESAELLRRRDVVVREISEAVRSGAAAADVAVLREEAERLLDDATRLVEDLPEREPTREAVMHAPRGVTAGDVRANLLRTGRALVEFVEGRRRLRAFVLTDEDLILVDLGDKATLRLDVDRYLALVSRAEQLGSADEIARRGRDLYERLLVPLLRVAGDVTELVVIPSTSVATLPLECLVIESIERPMSFSEVTFVGDAMRLYYGPSASVLVELTRRVPGDADRDRLLLLADPVYRPERTDGYADGTWPRGLPRLPETQAEARAICGLFGAHAKQLEKASASRSFHISNELMDAYTGDQASLARLADVEGYRWLHLATHGYEDRQTPYASGVALSWEDTSSGVLSVEDILWMSFDLDLVVLSACRTATGPRAREGVQSIAWAFLASGAGSVVASLWAVSDSGSARLMTSFYESWLGLGQPPGEALASARRTNRAGLDAGVARGVGTARTRSDRRAVDRRHPYFWAPFIYIGPPPP